MNDCEVCRFLSGEYERELNKVRRKTPKWMRIQTNMMLDYHVFGGVWPYLYEIDKSVLDRLHDHDRQHALDRLSDNPP